MNNNWTNFPKPIFALAPMAGISDQPFRLICKKMGADLLFSEMVSSEAIWHKKKPRNRETEKQRNELLKTLDLIKFSSQERPFIVQIFGSNPEHMAFAARYIASGEWARDYLKIENLKLSATRGSADSRKIESIPNGIDINMGCPARDITKNGAGAALLKNPELACKIVKAVKKSINIPLSIKTRIGWKDNKNILTFSRMLECSGADAVTIHGRTVAQGFSGPVDWPKICQVKKNLSIPVIGNGGIDNKFKIKNLKLSAMRGSADSRKIEPDGYMIGRGAQGNPWIFQQVKGKKLRVESLTFQSRKAIILEHAQLAERLKGKQGIVEMRKHLGWYFRGRPWASKIREKLIRVESLEDIKTVLNVYPIDKIG